MFSEIIEFVAKDQNLNEGHKAELTKFCNSLYNIEDRILLILNEIKEKYTFEYVSSLPEDFYDTMTLFFWIDRYEFQLSIALDDQDLDDDFLGFISEKDIYLPILDPNQDAQKYDDFMESVQSIYFYWLGYLWQKAKLFNCGIPMGITVNSDTDSYFFNDFLYNSTSAFDGLYQKKRIRGTIFNRPLTIEEIFIRTYCINSKYREINLFAKNSEGKERGLFLNDDKIMIYEYVTSKDSKKLILEQNLENSQFHSFLESFNDMVNEGWIFQLLKSNFKKTVPNNA